MDSLNINTIGQINNMVKNNIEIAYETAKIFLSDASFEGEMQQGIGLFYLCYAELFRREASDEEIKNYFECNNIGVPDLDDGPRKLREAFEAIKKNYEIK
ncbi:hypothetical protein FXB42_11965 [Acetobacterium wieringae]|uniref:Uncharacterized protein n=1 Tax=Acetobacterium wieringae TaxID=52694 RepID=A0A5D0WJY7_9FIRM|nr:hypothetical protein [Acetobacterium wieringae]TYC84477.1 hypothetical protein FXB42_11965 [Acetobacterium wieringae]